MAETEMAEASAEMFAEIAEIANPSEMEPTDMGQIMVNNMFTQSVGPLDRLTDQKGKVGQGTEGAQGRREGPNDTHALGGRGSGHRGRRPSCRCRSFFNFTNFR